MVAVISGSGLGLFGSSVASLGGVGNAGTAGRGNDRIFVNTSSGNLVVQSQDERLTALGLDLSLVRTYNSQGLLDDDNGDNWRLGVHQRLYNLPGIVNTAGSRVTKLFGDGREVVYEFKSERGAYVSSEGEGAHDTLTFAAGSWTWREGSSHVAETYDSNGRLTASTDADANTITYTYTDSLLTRIDDASGQTTELEYQGNNLVAIHVVSDGVTQTLTTYQYDSNSRLSSVTVDLTPQNTADAQVYVTSYTYEDASRRIASITQTDGSSVAFTYELIDGQYRVKTYTDGENRVTTFNYAQPTGAGAARYLQTEITDARGVVTRYEQNAEGRVLAVTVAPTGIALRTEYEYDADGNVTAIIEDPTGLNQRTSLSYDANGNLLGRRDSLGNTVERTYDGNNLLLTETVYTVADPDGAGSATPSGALTTHYTYDAEYHLRFVISAAGRVTEHRYDAAGERTRTLTYTNAMYSGSTFTTSQLSTWAGAQDQTRLQHIDYVYDFRGNVASVTAYDSTDANGSGTGNPSITRFVYDQRGQLLQTLSARGSDNAPNAGNANLPYATTYTYDGLGRVQNTTQWLSDGNISTTMYQYVDAIRSTSITAANGLVTTTLYNRAGEAISVANGSATAPSSLGTTTFAYDQAGRLRITTAPIEPNNPARARLFCFYDDAGRKIGAVDGDGTLTEHIYDDVGRVTKSVQYSTQLGSTTLASLIDSDGNPTNVAFAALRTEASATPSLDRITRNVYDANGALVYVIDEAGAVTKHSYDGVGRLVSSTRYALTVTIDRSVDQLLPADVVVTSNPDDRLTRIFYDADSLKVATLDGEGALVSFTYDAGGRLVRQIAHANATAESLRASGTLAQLQSSVGTDDETATDPERDAITDYIYDGRGQRVGMHDAEGYLTEFVYDVDGNVVERIRYDQQLAHVSAPTVQALRAQVLPASIRERTSYAYNNKGQVLSEVVSRGTSSSSAGTTTSYVYDTASRLMSTTRADGSTESRTTQTRHDLLGRVLQELTGEGYAQITAGMTPAQINDIWNRYSVTYAYDPAGRRVSATSRPNDTQTNVTLYYYDQDGRLRFEINALGERVEYRYNALNQLQQEIRYTNRISTSGLSGGLLTSALIATLTASPNADSDSLTTYTYTLTGRIESKRVASTSITAEDTLHTYAYNAFGELRTEVDSYSVATQYNYSKQGLLTQRIADVGSLNISQSRTYDVFGRLRTVTDGRQNVVQRFEYDRLGRTIATTDSGTSDRTVVAYDAFSRQLTVTDALNNVTSYQYNDANRSTTVVTPEGISVTTALNRHGQTLTVTAAGNTTVYQYDRDGQVTGISDSLGSLQSRTYDRAGRQVTQIGANSAVTSFEYDAVNRVLTRTVDSGTGGLQLATTYTYDGQGRVTRVDEPGGRRTDTTYYRDGRVREIAVDPDTMNLRTHYTYDREGRVSTLAEGYGSSNPRVVKYQYDHLGRRTSEIVDPGSGTNPATGRLYLNLETRYRYDANGNVTRKIDANNNSIWYVYDADNRVTHTVDALGGVTGNVYDLEDRIIQTRRYATPLTAATLTTLASTDAPTEAQVSRSNNAMDAVSRSFFDREGREKYTIDAAGTATERTYDANGKVTRTRIYNSPALTSTYADTAAVTAALGSAVGTIGSDDRLQWTAYDLRGYAAFTIDSLGGVVQYTYDANGNVTVKTEFATLRSTTAATDLASLQAWTSSNANNTSNRTTRYWYDTTDRLRFTLDAEGYLTEKSYADATREQTNTVYAAKPTDVTASSTLANLVTTASAIANSANDQSTRTAYDVAGRKIRIIDAFGRTEHFGYDAVGNKTSYTNKNGSAAGDVAYTWNYEYDAANRLMFERSPAVAVTTVDPTTLAVSETNSSFVTYNEYDAVGNVTHRHEAYGTVQVRTTSYEYDALGRQTATLSPTVGVYETAGDTQFGNGTAVGHTETSTRIVSETAYDVFGNAFRNRLVREDQRASATNGTFTYKAYDNLGRVRYEIDAKNQVTGYTYDAFGNKTVVTRYATPIAAPSRTGTSLMDSAVTPSTNNADRAISTTFDRLNRKISVRQPSVRNFAPTPNGTGGSYYDAQPTTEYVYNSFGEVIRASTQINSTEWAHTYSYYDRRGNKVAELDPSRHLTRFFYDDATGDLTRKIEYARATTGTVDYNSYGTIVTTTSSNAPIGSADSFAGYDRDTTYVYDKLNRKITETKLNLEYSSVNGSGALTTAYNGSQTTDYRYDALGNLTKVSDTTGATTYTFYDVLGRIIAVAEPARDLGQGTQLIAYKRMLRDAHGNLVQQIEHYNGLAADVFGATPADAPALPAAPTAHANDRRTTILVDRQGNALRTRDAGGADRYASYNMRGDIAKEWQVVVNPNVSSATSDDITETIVKLYRYDDLGQRTEVVESQRYNGANTETVTRVAEYNAFGEIIYKYNSGTAFAEREYYDYDNAGRVWRTNSGDGVDKVLMYDLAGNATLELRSQSVDLNAGRTVASLGTYTSAQSVISNVTAGALMRTESVYDANGNLVERRMPQFDIDSRFPPVATDIRIGTFSGTPYVYWTPPTNSGVTTFWYRIAGSTANYSSLTIDTLSGGVVGANLSTIYDQTYEFRIVSGFAGELMPTLESVGTFRVDHAISTSLSISQTPLSDADQIPTLTMVGGSLPSVSASIAAECQWGQPGPMAPLQWYGANVVHLAYATLGAGSFRAELTYQKQTRIGTASGQYATFTTTVAANSSSLTGWNLGSDPSFGTEGGIYSIYRVRIYQVDANGAEIATVRDMFPNTGPPSALRWSAPSDSNVTAVLRYKLAGSSSWSANVSAVRNGANFEVDLQSLMTSNATYDYEVEYVRASTVIARRAGQMSSTGVVTTRVVTGPISPTSINAFDQYVATPSVSGHELRWSPPSGASVVPTFEYRQGSGSYQSLNVAQGSLWSVSVSSLITSSTQSFEYRITYRIGARLVSQQTGSFTLTAPTSSVTITASATNGSAPAAVPALPALSGSNGALSASASIAAECRWGQPGPMAPLQWYGANVVHLSYPTLGAGSFRAEVTYQKRTRSGTGSGQYATFTTSVAANSSGLTGWNLGSDPSFGTEGGIFAVYRVRIYQVDGSGSIIATVRDSFATGTPTPPQITWSAPADSSLGYKFFYYVNGTPVERTITRSGNTLAADLSGIARGDYNYRIEYYRSGESTAIVGKTGSFRTDTVSITVLGQTDFDNNPAWIPVSSSGSTATWSYSASAGDTATFEFWSGSTPISVPVSGSSGSYSANFSSVGVGTYSYRVRYYHSGNPAPYAMATGSVTVTSAVINNPSVLSSSVSTNNKYPTAQITPVSLSGDRVSWEYPKASASDSVVFRYTVAGTTYAQPLSGSGPAFSTTLSNLPVASNTPLSWSLEYTRAGESSPYAAAQGTATLTVTQTTAQPTITIGSQENVYPTVRPIAAPTDLGGGYLGWTTSPSPGEAVTFTYSSGSGTPIPMPVEAYAGGYQVNVSSLAAGTYNYEITYASGSAVTARARGTFTVTKTPSGVGNTTLTNGAQRADTTLAFTPGFGSTLIVEPPYAVYHRIWQQPGQWQYLLGARPASEGGGYYLVQPGVYNLAANYFYGTRLAISVPRPATNGISLSVEFWSSATPSDVRTATVSTPSTDWWTADVEGASGIANGTYGYRITLRRNGALTPLGVQEGTFVVGGTNSLTVGASSSPAPLVATPTTRQKLDRWGNVIQVTDAANNVTDYRYNGFDQLVQTLEAQDYVYDRRDAAGANSIFGVLTRTEKTNHYDLLGRLVEAQDGYDQASRASYNSAGQLLTKRNADYARHTNGATSGNVYDLFGNLIQTQDELGYLKRYKYDGLGRLVAEWREIELNTFTNRTDATSTTVNSAANVQTLSYVYDQAGRRVSQTNGENETIRYQYDLLGNVTQVRTNLGSVTSYVYNADAKKTNEADALGSTKSWLYDAFGKLTSHTELGNTNTGIGVNGGTVITYNYNYAGQIFTQSSTASQNISYSYDRGGNLSSITDAGVNRRTSYRYDSAGRQARETVVVDNRLHQDTRISYDNHNRIKSLDDPDYRERILYDVNGQRAYVEATYPDHEWKVIQETLSYQYDEMGRVTQQITYSQDQQRNFITNLKYNGRGDRVLQTAPGQSWEPYNGSYRNANGFVADIDEQYDYDGLARLKTVYRNTWHSDTAPNPTNILIRSYTYDLANRQRTEMNAAIESSQLVTRNTTTNYDGDGRTISQTTTRTAGGVVRMESSVSYGTGSATLVNGTWSLGYDAASNLRGYEVQFYNSNGAATYKTTFRNEYNLFEGYTDRLQTARSAGSGAPGNGDTNRYYNANHELISFTDNQASTAPTRYFVNNQAGQILTSIRPWQSDVSAVWDIAMVRAQVDGAYNRANAQYYFYAQGNFIGQLGQAREGTAFQGRFDVNASPISDNYPSATPATVIAQAGDTLRTLAARVFGDAALWYILAEENGYTNPDADLPDGAQLRVPNEVISLSNTSNSFKPFNVTDALGDTTPTQPPPPQAKGGCGVMAMVLIIVVAIVVTVFTAGAAAAVIAPGATTATGAAGTWALGSAALTGGLTAGAGGAALVGSSIAAAAIGGAVGAAASQGVAIATGMQESFNWKDVALSVIGAGVGAGLGSAARGITAIRNVAANSPNLFAAANAAAGSALTQGITVATGLQSSFSWRAVAISAVTAPIADVAARQAGGMFNNAPASGFASRLVGGVAGSYVRRAFGGKIDTSTILADAFGNALGNSIVDRMSPQPTAQARSASADELQEVRITPRYIGPDAEVANARLDNNPTRSVYQTAAALTPDQTRAIEAGSPVPIEVVTITAPHWSFAEEMEYWRLRAPLYAYRPDGYFGGGMQDASEDEVAYRAQQNVAHDIRLTYRNFGDMQARADDLRLMRLFTPMNQLALGEGIISTATGAVGMVANGWASIAFQDTGFGAYVQEQLTYSPRLQISHDAFSALAPLTEGLNYARSTFGDAGYSVTGSPAVGAALTTLPDALALALVPEARFATANVARGVGNGVIQGGKWLADGAVEMLYQTSERMLNATGQRMYVVAPGAPATAQTVAVTQSIGELRAAGLKDAHHVIQDAAVRDLPGYDTNAAPGVQLQGPSTARGTPHYNATQAQRGTGGGTYGAERQIAYDALRAGGYSEAQAIQAIAEADRYFNGIGVTESTLTRIPGNRRP